jgi:hypothetical protein
VTKEQLTAKVAKIIKGQESLGDIEDLIGEVIGAEEAQGIRDVLIAAKMSVHATRMALMVGTSKLRMVAPLPAEKAA